MRISTSKLQQMAIFTTVLTGGGIGTMYYLLQKDFSGSEYHRLALGCLEASGTAMAALGAPPLRVYNIHLTDRHNRVDHHSAQIKIPVKGSKTGGYLYTSSIRDADTNRWSLKLATLQLREGQLINLLTPDPLTSDPPMTPDDPMMTPDPTGELGATSFGMTPWNDASPSPFPPPPSVPHPHPQSHPSVSPSPPPAYEDRRLTACHEAPPPPTSH